MTTKFEGNITLENNTVKMPTNKQIPEKKTWNNFSIWEFNGKRYRPLTRNAETNLESIVSALESEGYKHARKSGARKATSLKYAIQTTGVEEFTWVK